MNLIRYSRIAATAAALLLPLETRAVEEDKIVHASGSAVVAAVLTVALKDSKHPALYASLITLGLGVAKEIIDSRPGGSGFSGSDLTADAVGTVAGAGVGWLIIRPNFVGVRAKW